MRRAAPPSAPAAPYAACCSRACSGSPSSTSIRRSRCSWSRCGPGTLETGYQQTWNWGIYPEAITEYWPWIVRSIVYGGLATILAFALGFPLAYAIAFRGGRYKNVLLFLVIAPFFTSFLLRTISWKIILADYGLVLGPLKQIGILPEEFRLLATPAAVIAGHHLQLPAVHDAAAVRRPREDRQAADRGGRGPVRRSVAAAGHDRRGVVGGVARAASSALVMEYGPLVAGDPGRRSSARSIGTFLISQAFIRVTLPLALPGHLRRVAADVHPGGR